MGLLAFFRLGVWMNGLRAFRNGFMGNVFGEGFVLGGVYVIGRGQQVKLLAWRTIGSSINVSHNCNVSLRQFIYFNLF